MNGRLGGKVAIVTGASRGIGRAIAEAFVREGARIVIASRRQEVLDGVAADLNAVHPESTFARACHMGDTDAIASLVDFAESTVGTPDILVNNAATNPYFGPAIWIDAAAYDKTFEVNLRGPFEAARLVAQSWTAAGRSGVIINVASTSGLAAAPLQGVYAMTKAALVSLTQTLACELGPAGIRVNAIAPGLVDTKLASALVSDEELVKHYTERAALKRYGYPAEIAGPAVFLASDESSYVTGQVLVVDGGYLAS